MILNYSCIKKNNCTYYELCLNKLGSFFSHKIRPYLRVFNTTFDNLREYPHPETPRYRNYYVHELNYYVRGYKQ